MVQIETNADISNLFKYRKSQERAFPRDNFPNMSAYCAIIINGTELVDLQTEAFGEEEKTESAQVETSKSRSILLNCPTICCPLAFESLECLSIHLEDAHG